MLHSAVTLVLESPVGTRIIVGEVDIRLDDLDSGQAVDSKHVLRTQNGDMAGQIRLSLRREDIITYDARHYTELRESLMVSAPGIDQLLSNLTAIQGCSVILVNIAAATGQLKPLLYSLLPGECRAREYSVFACVPVCSHIDADRPRLVSSCCHFVSIKHGSHQITGDNHEAVCGRVCQTCSRANNKGRMRS